MPIIGLTDRAPQFPKIGDIRKGAPKTDNRPGKDLKHFRAVFPEDEAAAAAAFFTAYGAEPREINIMLPFGDVDRNFEAWQEEHTASALQHRCDGVTCVMWRDEDGRMRHTPKPCPGGCKATGRLKVIIPELRRLAYVEVHTTSIWDITEITANLESLRRLNAGTVSGVPLVLRRRPRQISTPRPDGKRVRQTKSLLSIEAEPLWVDAKLTAMRIAALPGPAALPESVEPESIEEGELVVIDEVEPEPEPADPPPTGPDLPTDWQPFAQHAIDTLGYRTVMHVRDTLHEQGIERICTPLGVLEFDPLDGWALLQDQAPQPKAQQTKMAV